MRAWRIILIIVTIGVALSGMTMAVAPGLARRAFSLLIYASSDQIDGFGGPAVAYVSLTHSVLGSVIAGWATALLLVLIDPFRQEQRKAWWIIAASVAVWFVPDTAMSMWLGFWTNAALNLGLALLFAVPLAAIWRGSSQRQPGVRPSDRT